MGYIKKNELETLAGAMGNSPYARYLRAMLEDRI
jgi:hypothetical protein